MDAEQDSIVLDPNVLAGKPTNYPGIGRRNILACLAFTHETSRSERVIPGAASCGYVEFV